MISFILLQPLTIQCLFSLDCRLSSRLLSSVVLVLCNSSCFHCVVKYEQFVSWSCQRSQPQTSRIGLNTDPFLKHNLLYLVYRFGLLDSFNPPTMYINASIKCFTFFVNYIANYFFWLMLSITGHPEAKTTKLETMKTFQE